MLTRNRIVGALTALTLTGAMAGCSPFGGSDRTVTAYFEDTAGLFVGNEVTVLGVAVGQVTGVEAEGQQVKVTLDITDEDLKLPKDVGAVIVARSVATDRVVELTPVFQEGADASGDVTIPIERTKVPVEWDEILGALDRFTSGLSGKDGQAGELSHLLEVGAGALEGTGELANQTLKDLANATQVLADHRGDITGSIDNLATLTSVLAANETTIDAFASNVTQAVKLFDDTKGDLGDSLVALSNALDTLGQFIKDNRKDLKTAVVGLTDVTDNLLNHETQLKEAVEQLPIAFENLGKAVTVSGTVNVRLPLDDLSPVPALTDAICGAVGADLCNVLGLDVANSLEDLLKILGGA